MTEPGEIEQLAELLAQRNRIDARIARLIGRPALPGHIGEFIAAGIFRLRLHASATAAASDGIFSDGPLAGASVNVKLYGKDQGILDLPADGAPTAAYTLALVGPRSAAASSKGTTSPIVVCAVYLFRNDELLAKLRIRGVKIGTATSVTRAFWTAAEIYPRNTGTMLVLDKHQRGLLALFGPVPQLP